MDRRTIKIAMNGVTGRMGYRQHLVRSLLALREQGGLPLGDGTVLWPEPVLVGRREPALREIAERHGLEHVSTDLEAVLADPEVEIYFDAQVTSARETAIRQAVAAGKHVYCEKPTALTFASSLELARLAAAAGIKHGVVQDKLFLPGLLKLRRLIEGGFFGEVLSVRGEFGYWVFEGDWQTAQRPSWNYRAQDGGGIVADMFPHWEYLLHELFGRVRTVQALTRTHIARRWDEEGKPYEATADDAAYGIFELEGGAVAQINSSWAVRVHREELVEFQVDGTHGSAVAGLRNCRIQHRGQPRNPCGTRICRRPRRSAPSGRRCRTTPPPTTASRPSGSSSCAMSSSTNPGSGICWPGRAEYSSPSSACGPRPRAGGCRCRR